MTPDEKQPANMDEAMIERARRLAIQICAELVTCDPLLFASSIQAEARQEIERLTRDLDKEKSYTNCDKLRIERQTKRHWQQRAEAAEHQLAEYTENRQVGVCVDCGTALWFRQERIEDETGMYHPLCRAIKVARVQGMREAGRIVRSKKEAFNNNAAQALYNDTCDDLAAAIERAAESQSIPPYRAKPNEWKDSTKYAGYEQRINEDGHLETRPKASAGESQKAGTTSPKLDLTKQSNP